jgi:hypothetical protein
MRVKEIAENVRVYSFMVFFFGATLYFTCVEPIDRVVYPRRKNRFVSELKHDSISTAKYSLNDRLFLKQVGAEGDIASAKKKETIDSLADELMKREYLDSVKNEREFCFNNLSRLNYADLLKVRVLLHEYAKQENVDARGRMLEADLVDKESEHGSKSILAGNRLRFFEVPYLKKNDLYRLIGKENDIYYSSEVKKPGWFSADHYHAIKRDCGKYAYPSETRFFLTTGADIGQAMRSKVDETVLTILPQERFDLTFYTDYRVVIDLGIYKYNVQK